MKTEKFSLYLEMLSLLRTRQETLSEADNSFIELWGYNFVNKLF